MRSASMPAEMVCSTSRFIASHVQRPARVGNCNVGIKDGIAVSAKVRELSSDADGLCGIASVVGIFELAEFGLHLFAPIWVGDNWTIANSL